MKRFPHLVPVLGAAILLAALCFIKPPGGSPADVPIHRSDFLLNTFVMMMVSLSLSYLLGLFVKSSNMLNGLSNIVSLGMCFLSGVFVPMSVMDKKVLKIAQFLPVYWYEDINETLARYHSVSGNIATDIWKSLGIEVMFALAFVAIILALSKYKRQK